MVMMWYFVGGASGHWTCWQTMMHLIFCWHQPCWLRGALHVHRRDWLIFVGGAHAKTTLTGVTVGVDVSASEKIWRTFQSLGDIAFAYSYSNVLIEIQVTKLRCTLTWVDITTCWRTSWKKHTWCVRVDIWNFMSYLIFWKKEKLSQKKTVWFWEDIYAHSRDLLDPSCWKTNSVG
jgi:hypothetical protein